MDRGITYAHTNIVAKDYEKLAEFYIKVFGCKPLEPKRDLSGDWIDRVTGIDHVRIRGIHLLLPGYDDGPTLEIFEYIPECLKDAQTRIDRQGFGHIAFRVNDVRAVLDDVLREGGSLLGQVVEKDYGEMGLLTVVYTRDPEGNIVEIQSFK